MKPILLQSVRQISLTLLLVLASCQRVSTDLEPHLVAPAHPKQIQREKRCFVNLPQDFSVSPFAPLTATEKETDWGKEYMIALMFAEDFDLYRAVTGFKRALCFLPADATERRLEIDYQITLAYFLGKKYVEAIWTVESTGLAKIDETFVAFDDLLLILYDSYSEVGKAFQADQILTLIQQRKPEQGRKLVLLSQMRHPDIEELSLSDSPHLSKMIVSYQKEAKSPKKASLLNACLPGAGYWYLGQKQTAVTALLVNGLFTGAAACFAVYGNAPAAAITLSLEGGWYFGGIYGAGLSAKQYNEKLYCNYAERVNQKERFFPSMMLKYSF